jgi:Protein of unknown function (DUF2970)
VLFPIPGWLNDGCIPNQQEQRCEFLRLARIAPSGFFGVRKRASHEADFANVNFVLLPLAAALMRSGHRRNHI